MARWFRSEDMAYVSIIVNEDAAHTCISDLGKMGMIQFTDLNPELTAFQRRYVAYIKRIDELERKLAFFGEEVKKFDLKVASAGTVESFVQSSGQGGMESKSVLGGQALLQKLEADLEALESHLVELNTYNERLTSEYNEKVELQEVLLKTKGLFAAEMPHMRLEEQAAGARRYQDVEHGGSLQVSGGAPSQPSRESDMKFSYMAGVVGADDRSRFERQLFRTTRGNCYVRFAEIEQPISDPTTGEQVMKLVFIVFYKAAAIEAKIKKICEAFRAKRYDLPEMDDGEGVKKLMYDNYGEMHDARVVLLKNRDARMSLCATAADRLESWTWTVLREKAVYHTLNTFKPDVRGILRGEGWVVKEGLAGVQMAVNRAHAEMDTGMPSMVEVMPKPWPTPPTYFKLNAFTIAFQEFVDTYGVPRYKEANPALFTAASFPFLYGIMFGDIGHGACILFLGLFLIFTHAGVAGRRDLGELMGGLYLARYMIAMMGFFSVYAGLIYNDFFSLPLNLFGSSWTWTDGYDTEEGTDAVNVGKYGDPDNVYPFGVDPAWHVAGNELLFFNSMKMKTSVILGVTQMTFGVCLKAMNALYFKESLDFFYEFIPMIVFVLSLFGYMIVLIFMKWSINWEYRMFTATCFDGWTPQNEACDASSTTADMCPLDYGGSGDGCQPPNLITTLINIALSPGSVDEPMYAGQSGVQSVLLLLALVSIPVLLLAKPLTIRSRMNKAAERHDSFSSESQLMGGEPTSTGEKPGDGHAAGGDHGGGHEEHDFSEIVIHQAIETIEFVLGMVSNTASYLRLWALSLAHTELAAVFWEKAMLATIEMGNAFAIFIGFAIFAGVTFGVILCMDVLECFLHALRLHWVEFQNKFYKADGYKFAPFSIAAIVKEAPVMFARRRANERKLASKANGTYNASRAVGVEEGAPKTVELGAAAREEFVVKISRRDDILQDVWLKMHSAQGFAQAQGGGDLTQLLTLYRSASLDVIESMMRQPELEKVADGYTRKKGDGMRSYREAVAQDADFADGTEAVAWLGFSTRRNPLFLPPKALNAAAAKAKCAPSSAIDLIDSGLLARLRDAQDFILLEKNDSSSATSEFPVDEDGGTLQAKDYGGTTLPGEGSGGGGGGGCSRRLTIRDRVRAMNGQLASSQERIRELEDDLRSLEARRDSDRERATRARAAAAEAGRRNLTQKMYRLRGNAAFLEEGLSELEGELTAVRVRRFAETLDVARKRMLKDALTAEISAKSKARRRRGNRQDKSPKASCPPTRNSTTSRPDDDTHSKQEDTSASTIEVRVRGLQARRLNTQTHDVSDYTPGREEKRCRSTHQEEAAAVRIGAAARGRLARKRIERAAQEARGLEATKEVGGELAASGAKEATVKQQAIGKQQQQHQQQENEHFATVAGGPSTTPLPATRAEVKPETKVAAVTASAVSEGLAQVEALGMVGVRAVFDSLGLGGCTNRLRASNGGIDGAELARIARASDPDAELLAAGVSARLHRVKLLSALGVSARVPGETVPSRSSTLDEDLPGGSGGLARITTIAALHMVRQLRREQDRIADVLCKSTRSTSNRSRKDLGDALPPEFEDNGAWDVSDGASGGPKETVDSRAAVLGGEVVSFASLVLTELEEALSTQFQLSRQVQELKTGPGTDRPAYATIDTNTIDITPTG
eukprot:g5581.t3